MHGRAYGSKRGDETNMIIRRAKINELNELRDFYNANWGCKHAIINLKAFVDYYFVNGEYLNFVVARYTDGSEIVSACGYVLSNSTNNPDAWTTLWLTKKGASSNIGLQIVNYLAAEMGFRTLATNNAKQNTLVLYKFLGYATAKMDHFYRLSSKENYDVAIIKNREILPYETTQYSIQQFNNPQELLNVFDPSNLTNGNPYKDINYIIKRFFDFPFYNYLVFGILDEGSCCNSIIVFRKAAINSTSVLRIVDLIGRYDDFAKIGHCIQWLLQSLGCEYVDFYCYGIAPEILAKAGFSKRNEGDGNIIPNYLEPYAPINAEHYFFVNMADNFVMFKADGDQDRPNIELI
jgi:hypothetical protein